MCDGRAGHAAGCSPECFAIESDRATAEMGKLHSHAWRSALQDMRLRISARNHPASLVPKASKLQMLIELVKPEELPAAHCLMARLKIIWFRIACASDGRCWKECIIGDANVPSVGSNKAHRCITRNMCPSLSRRPASSLARQQEVNTCPRPSLPTLPPQNVAQPCGLRSCRNYCTDQARGVTFKARRRIKP